MLLKHFYDIALSDVAGHGIQQFLIINNSCNNDNKPIGKIEECCFKIIIVFLFQLRAPNIIVVHYIVARNGYYAH